MERLYYRTSKTPKFLNLNDTEKGFGEHMYSAILVRPESQRQELAKIFGDEHTCVAPDFDELIEVNMERYEKGTVTLTNS